LVVNRAEDTTTVARLATPAVASVTWRKTAARDRNATTAAAWDTSAATATKLLRPKSVTGANNPGTSPATVPTTQSKPARRSARKRGRLRAILLPLNFLLKIVHVQSQLIGNKKMVLFNLLSPFLFTACVCVCVCVWFRLFRAISSICACSWEPATGYAENKWRAVLDVPKFLH